MSFPHSSDISRLTLPLFIILQAPTLGKHQSSNPYLITKEFYGSIFLSLKNEGYRALSSQVLNAIARNRNQTVFRDKQGLFSKEVENATNGLKSRTERDGQERF